METKLPGSHNPQKVAPDDACAEPAGHERQVEAPALLNVPAGHAKQLTVPLLLLTILLKVPAAHAVQTVLPNAGALVATGHALHAVAPVPGEKKPWGQATH